MANRKKTVAVFGSGQCGQDNHAYYLAQLVGDELARRGVTVVTGAYGGVMEAAAQGAKERSGEAIGFSLGRMMKLIPNSFLTKVVDCGAKAARTGIKHAAFGLRLCGLLSADGFVLVASGGIGTVLEFVAFLLFATKLWPKDKLIKRMAVFTTALGPSNAYMGWALERLVKDLVKSEIISQEVYDLVRFISGPNPSGAINWVLDGTAPVAKWVPPQY